MNPNADLKPGPLTANAALADLDLEECLPPEQREHLRRVVGKWLAATPPKVKTTALDSALKQRHRLNDFRRELCAPRKEEDGKLKAPTGWATHYEALLPNTATIWEEGRTRPKRADVLAFLLCLAFRRNKNTEQGAVNTFENDAAALAKEWLNEQRWAEFKAELKRCLIANAHLEPLPPSAEGADERPHRKWLAECIRKVEQSGRTPSSWWSMLDGLARVLGRDKYDRTGRSLFEVADDLATVRTPNGHPALPFHWFMALRAATPTAASAGSSETARLNEFAFALLLASIDDWLAERLAALEPVRAGKAPGTNDDAVVVHRAESPTDLLLEALAAASYLKIPLKLRKSPHDAGRVDIANLVTERPPLELGRLDDALASEKQLTFEALRDVAFDITWETAAPYRSTPQPPGGRKRITKDMLADHLQAYRAREGVELLMRWPSDSPGTAGHVQRIRADLAELCVRSYTAASSNGAGGEEWESLYADISRLIEALQHVESFAHP